VSAISFPLPVALLLSEGGTDVSAVSPPPPLALSLPSLYFFFYFGAEPTQGFTASVVK
jgi:hypothetical protein